MDDEDKLKELLERSAHGLHIETGQSPATVNSVRAALSEVIESVPLLEPLFKEANLNTLSNQQDYQIEEILELLERCHVLSESHFNVSKVSFDYFYQQLQTFVKAVPGEDVPVCHCISVRKLCAILVSYCKPQQDLSSLEEMIFAKIPYLPLLIIQILLEEGVISFKRYLCHLDRTGYLEILTSQLINVYEICTVKSSDSESFQSCLAYVMKALVSLTYGHDSESNKDDFEKLPNLQRRLRRKVIHKIQAYEVRHIFKGNQVTNSLCGTLRTDEEIHRETNRKFLKDYLANLISGNSTLEEIVQSFGKQAKWSFKDIPNEVKKALKHLVVLLDINSILDTITEAIVRHDIDVEKMLKFATISVTAFCEDEELTFLNFIKLLFCQGLEKGRQFDVVLSILLQRHFILSDPASFPPYSECLARLIEAGRELFQQRSCLELYCKVLTSILPYEQIDFLRCHIATFPTVSKTLQPIGDDYLSVAKATLSDLKSSSKQSNRYSKPTGNLCSAQEEVQSAVKYFSENHCVPRFVIEMSVFKKAYYENSFLPTLLVPCSNINDSNPRLDFIKKLKEINKISGRTWETFLRSCKQIAFFETIETSKDTAVDLILKEIKELRDLRPFTNELGSKAETKYTLKSYVSSLECYLEEFVLRMSNNNNYVSYLECISDELLNSMCSYMKNNVTEGDLLKVIDLKWMKSILSMLTRIEDLLCSLAKRIEDVMNYHCHSLEVYHVYTFAALSHCASLIGTKLANENLPMITLNNLVKVDRIYSWKYQLFLLTFIALFLYLASNTNGDLIVMPTEALEDCKETYGVIPYHVLALFMGFYDRLQFILKAAEEKKHFMGSECKHNLPKIKNIAKLVETVLSDVKIQHLTASCSNSITDWLRIEINTSLNSDFIQHNKKACFLQHRAKFLIAKDCIGILELCKCIFDSLVVRRRHYLDSSSHCQHDHSSNERYQDSEREIINLLRYFAEQVTCFQITYADDCTNRELSGNSWLMQYLYDRIFALASSDDVRKQQEARVAFELCPCLPPSSLCTRNCSPENLQHSLASLGKVVSISGSLLRHGFTLPVDWTEYLLKATSVLFSNVETTCQSSTDALLGFFRHDGQLLLLSALLHDDCLVWYEERTSNAACVLQMLHPLRKKTVCHAYESLSRDISTAALAIIVYNNWHDNILNEQSLLAKNSNILLALLECSMIEWMDSFLQGEMDFNTTHGAITRGANVMTRILRTSPGCLKQISNQEIAYRCEEGLSTLRKSLIRESYAVLYPIVLVKILGQLGEITLKDISQKKNISDIVILITKWASCCISENSLGITFPVLDSIQHLERIFRIL